MTDRPWSQMLPTDHLDKAEALTIEARQRVPAEAVAMRREAELHLLSAQVQALRLQTATPVRPRAAECCGNTQGGGGTRCGHADGA